jgi:hypothetical protein
MRSLEQNRCIVGQERQAILLLCFLYGPIMSGFPVESAVDTVNAGLDWADFHFCSQEINVNSFTKPAICLSAKAGAFRILLLHPCGTSCHIGCCTSSAM